MTSDAPAPAEQPDKEELLFALHHRDKPTLAFVECKSNAKRDELEAWLQQELPEYQFYTLDVTPLPVASLLRTLAENLPPAVRDAPPVSYVVNVYGLENRLDEALAAQLNLERELLFRRVPYIILVWADAYFFRKLQRLAPDLWHWVTYKFRFDDPTVRPAEELPPLPERVRQRGDIEVRRQRIQELEERYSHLDLSDNNKPRLLRDKITIKNLLAAEYAEAFEFSKAIAAYRDALGLDAQIQAVTVQKFGLSQINLRRGYLLFNLGWACFKGRLFEEALNLFSQSKELLPIGENGRIYHQVGMVYTAQGEWRAAIENYEQAISCSSQVDYGVGETYHQLGIVYAHLERWSLALASYEQSIDWKKRVGDDENLGNTYHQIGNLYQKQEQWGLALENYEQALNWKIQTGEDFEIGATYHQIGITYAAQQQWVAALANYEQALSWRQQVGDTYELPGTYFQIGCLYEDQNQFIEALSWFEKAVASAANHPNLPLAEVAVARIREALTNASET